MLPLMLGSTACPNSDVRARGRKKPLRGRRYQHGSVTIRKHGKHSVLGSPMVRERTDALARAWPQFTTAKRGRGVPVGRDPTAYHRWSPGHTQGAPVIGELRGGNVLAT